MIGRKLEWVVWEGSRRTEKGKTDWINRRLSMEG